MDRLEQGLVREAEARRRGLSSLQEQLSSELAAFSRHQEVRAPPTPLTNIRVRGALLTAGTALQRARRLQPPPGGTPPPSPPNKYKYGDSGRKIAR
eukprot:929004-Prorocentrum_minimum.AAC.3